MIDPFLLSHPPPPPPHKYSIISCPGGVQHKGLSILNVITPTSCGLQSIYLVWQKDSKTKRGESLSKTCTVQQTPFLDVSALIQQENI